MSYVLGKSPELCIGQKPTLTDLRPRGSATFEHNISSKFGKLGLRGKKMYLYQIS